MASEFVDATAEAAAALAMKMGSAAVDASSLFTDLGEELPILRPVLLTLKAIREKVETVQENREELAALRERCNYVTAFFVARSRESARPQMDVGPLKDCVEVAEKFIERCSGRGGLSRVLKASRDKGELAGINARIDRLAADLRLSGIATILWEIDRLKAVLVSAGAS